MEIQLKKGIGGTNFRGYNSCTLRRLLTKFEKFCTRKIFFKDPNCKNQYLKKEITQKSQFVNFYLQSEKEDKFYSHEEKMERCQGSLKVHQLIKLFYIIHVIILRHS